MMTMIELMVSWWYDDAGVADGANAITLGPDLQKKTVFFDGWGRLVKLLVVTGSK